MPMINGLSLIGCLWLVLLSANSTLATEKENLWSRNIMICKNSECSIDKITWESNQEYNNYQGYDVDVTKHYCKSPGPWEPILKSLHARDNKHNKLFLEQVILGNCYEVSFPKKIVLFGIVIKNIHWQIRRAQWFYDQPEEMYVGFTLSSPAND
jgi:hypothetical protein